MNLGHITEKELPFIAEELYLLESSNSEQPFSKEQKKMETLELETWDDDFNEWSSQPGSSEDWLNIWNWLPESKENIDQDNNNAVLIDNATKLLSAGIGIIPGVLSTSSQGSNDDSTKILQNLAQSLGILQAQQGATSPTLQLSQLELEKIKLAQAQAQVQTPFYQDSKMLFGLGIGAGLLLLLLIKRN